jgi:hypothetical protein
MDCGVGRLVGRADRLGHAGRAEKIFVENLGTALRFL